jgi:GDP-L-fucose synthase
MSQSEKTTEFLVLGGRGLVGSAVVRRLHAEGQNYFAATREHVDITDADSISRIFEKCRPRVVIAAAAKVGGLMANYTYPVEFLSENVLSQTLLMQKAHESQVEKFVFLGSSCIYPKFATQPVNESSLLTGELEITNEAYAIAKISGVKLVQAYRREYGHKWISVMPTNLFGINDNFDLKTSHALPALMRKFHEATVENKPSVQLWGTGNPRREFMYVDEFADALLFAIDNYDEDEPINIGTGQDISISELAEIMSEVTGYSGKVLWNHDIPDGTFRKLLDVSKLNRLGWNSKMDLKSAIEETYVWFKANYMNARLNVEIRQV